jgi:DNA polymerase IV
MTVGSRSVTPPDDQGCTILHADMDAFYAAVAVRDDPSLRGKPVIVGAGPRSVVLSATYEARALGIHAAMPVSRAKRLAPQAIFVSPVHHRYSEVSASVMEIFRSITPLVEPLSLDEAFLDVQGALRLIGSPREIAEIIRTRVADEQGITCSIGVAATKFVAKVASGSCKPDGVLVVPADQTITFLHPLSVGALWGVGPKTEETLHRLGLRSIGDIAHTPVATLVRALGDAQGHHLHDLAWGRDIRRVIPDEPEKSVGAEETFATDIDNTEVIAGELLRLSERVSTRLRRAGVRGRTISIKVKFADFTTITRSKTVRDATDLTQEIYAVSRALFLALHLDRARIRLVGVRVEGLIDSDEAPTQLLLDARERGWREAEQAADRAAERFGQQIVRPARLVRRKNDEQNSNFQ